MLRHYIFCLLFVLFCFCIADVAVATTVSTVDLTCPVCGTALKGNVIMSSNSFGGQDRDFLNRAVGTQPFLVLPTTCPNCKYSGYTDDFKEKVSDELKTKILTDKVLKVPDHTKLRLGRVPATPFKPEGVEVAGGELPAWVRHDLVAQVMKLRGATEFELAQQYHTASWAVRFEENPFDRIGYGLPDSEQEWIGTTVEPLMESKDEDANPALIEIAAARTMLMKLKAYPEEHRRTAANFVGSILRNHGENTLLVASLPQLKPYYTEAEWSTIEAELKLSLELERLYQRQALDLLKKDVDAGNFKSKDEAAAFTYLVGEIYRRLGEDKNAVAYFDRVLKMDGVPEHALQYAKEQKALIPVKN